MSGPHRTIRPVDLDNPWIRRNVAALERLVERDDFAAAAFYGRLFEEAWDRRTCMLCAGPMDEPVTRKLVSRNGRRIGSEVLGHDRCLDRYASERGYLSTAGLTD
jgi:hypothetical protein